MADSKEQAIIIPFLDESEKKKQYNYFKTMFVSQKKF